MGFFEDFNDYMAKRDRNDRIKGKKLYKLTMIAAILAFVFFLVMTIAVNGNIGIWTKLLENDSTAETTLTVKEIGALFSKRYQVTYAYTVDGKEYTGAQMLNQKEYEKIGGITAQTVHYDPENPSVSIFQQALDTAKSQQGGVLWATISMGCSALLLFGLTLLRRKDWVPAGFELVGVCNTCMSSLFRPLTLEARRNAIGKYRSCSVYVCDNCGKTTCEACGGFGIGMIGKRCSCGSSSMTVTTAYKK